MGRSLVETREHRSCYERNMAHLIVVAHKTPHSGEVVKPHDSRELDLLVAGTPQQVDVAEPLDPQCLNPRDNLGPHDRLVCVRVLRCRPSPPNSANHAQFRSPSCLQLPPRPLAYLGKLLSDMARQKTRATREPAVPGCRDAA